MYAPAEGTGPPGRSCRAAEGQAGLAVTQETAQAQAAGSRTLTWKGRNRGHCPLGLKGYWKGCGFRSLGVERN